MESHFAKRLALAGVILSQMNFVPPSHSEDAAAFVLVDHGTGEVLLSKNGDAPRQIASLTKIASTLVILEWMKKTDRDPATLRVRVPKEAIRGGANPLGLMAGDEITIETGLFAAMMASDNTSMHTLAEAVGDQMIAGGESVSGIQRFVDRMNQLSESIGLKHTRFVNPHGLDETGEKGVSCAFDVARLALYAEDLPDFRRYAAERERKVSIFRGGRELSVDLKSTNELLGSRGIDGTKTGTTRLAGACLVVTATRDLLEDGRPVPHRLVAVILDSPDRFREAVLLLDKGWNLLAARSGEAGKGNPKESLRKETE